MVHTISTRIPKTESQPVNMPNYQKARAGFDWSHARAELAGLPGGGLNIAHETVMRRISGSMAETAALRWFAEGGATMECSYAELAREVARFANLLDLLGVEAGDRVCSFARWRPHLYVAALGTLAHRSVFCPLFPTLDPEPIVARMTVSRAKVVITTEQFYIHKLAPLRDRLPFLEHVLLLDLDPDREPPAGSRSLVAALRDVSHTYEIPLTSPDDPALLHFTSGTTGEPKPVLHTHEAVFCHHTSGRLALDLRPRDVYWCTAEPGWVPGTAYGIIAPLTNGATVVVNEAEFDARRCYQILERQRVTVWYTQPSVIRKLMHAGLRVAREYDLSKLRFIASVGEPLNPEAVRWGVKAFGQAIHDNWWQTETGGIMIANYASMPVLPGSMGKPLPGIEVGIVAREAGGFELITTPGVIGELAVRTPWPAMFGAYLDQPERYAECFVDGWYLSGDLASRDAEGYLWFVARADEVIEAADRLIGPFEIESVFLEHPAVAEIVAIGKPDTTGGSIVKAFITLAPGFVPRGALRRELLGFGRAGLGPSAAPHEIEFVDELPRNQSGQFMRRLLAARELGVAEGDTSTVVCPSDD